MKKIILTSLLFIFTIIITGCSNDNIINNYKLQIKESSWSGMKNYKPKEVTEKYDIVLGKKYTISGFLTFKIERINTNYIVIKTTDAFSDSKKGINLNSKKKIFKIYINKETKLTTLTMDAGEIYYLKLTK